jgi:hypothetical protein
MAHPFDELAKVLAQGVSRREALRRIGGGLATALLAAMGLKRAYAACGQAAFDACMQNRRDFCFQEEIQCIQECKVPNRANCVNRCQREEDRCLQISERYCRNQTKCPKGEVCDTATGTCVSECKPPCTGGKTCVDRSCQCPTGKADCGGTCVDTATDPQNCRFCGRACPSGQKCQGGDCVTPGGGGGDEYCREQGFPEGYHLCSGSVAGTPSISCCPPTHGCCPTGACFPKPGYHCCSCPPWICLDGTTCCCPPPGPEGQGQGDCCPPERPVCVIIDGRGFCSPPL